MTLSLHSPREPLLSLYRRICVLEARGQAADASQLAAAQLGPAVDALRAATAVTDAELEALFAAEKERVANAGVLAELLLPSLTTLLETIRAVPKQARDSASPNGFPAAPDRPATVSGQGPAEIADFIDEMLSQRSSRPVRAG